MYNSLHKNVLGIDDEIVYNYFFLVISFLKFQRFLNVPFLLIWSSTKIDLGLKVKSNEIRKVNESAVLVKFLCLFSII